MEAEKPEPYADLETAVDAAIAMCDGDLRDTIRALIVANGFLAEQARAPTARGGPIVRPNGSTNQRGSPR